MAGRNYEYDPKYCDELISHMKNGNSFTTFAAKIGVVRRTLYNWVTEFPEFADAKDIGFAEAQYFYETRLAAKVSGSKINGIEKKEIDTACLIFALKTRFHETYSEKKQIELSGNLNASIVDAIEGEE